MRKTVLAFAVICASFITAFGNTPNNIPVTPEEKPSAVILVPDVKVSSGQNPVILRDLKITVEAIGNIAMTTYDMVFYNPNRDIIEGEFVMPLSGKQSISAIALDINGKMRDSAAVEKQTALQTSVPVVNKSEVSSGTVNACTSANQFKVKIYPFNPEGVRRIKITAEEPFSVKENKYIYTLPLNFGKQVNFDMNVEIPSEIIDGDPQVKTALPDFSFKKGNNVLKADFSQRDFLLDEVFSLSLTMPKNEPVFTHKEGKDTYFYADINVKPASKNKVLPKTMAIVWDSSLSSEKRDIKKELALLDAYFKKISDVEVTFVSFNIRSNSGKNYSVKKGNWEEIKKDISRIVYDGATRFDKLNLNDLKTDEILLFSDGISSFGNTRISSNGSVPVIAVNSSNDFDPGMLKSIAMKSGGCFIDLNSVSGKEALNLLLKQNLKLVSYSFDKNKIKEVYPHRGMPVIENYSFAGILTAPEAEITLSFGYDKNNIVSTKKMKIRSEGTSPAVERLWACEKIKYLSLNAENNKKEIVKLGRKYSLITAFTSLKVLENAYDYARYKITPPGELLEEYKKITALMQEEEKNIKILALEDAVLQVQDIKDWWKHNYAPGKTVISSESVKTAFGVNQDTIFGITIPPASAGEVKAPKSAQTQTGYGNEKKMILHGSAERERSYANKKNAAASYKTLQIKAWDPQVPYMKIIRNSYDDEIYSDYLKLKAGYGDQPSFFFDIADEFIRRKMKKEAVAVLSNIAEMNLENPELLRIAAYKLMEVKSNSYAVEMFEKIVKINSEDPQSHRDLALAYQANKEYKKALNTFYNILVRNWDRFQSIKQVVFVEMNNLISLHPEIILSDIDKRLIFAMPVDIRIVLGWSTDNLDIDIYVKEPLGGEASYENRFTGIGGRVSEDLTQGFGPEEYMLKKAPDGKYEVFTDYYGDGRQTISGPTVLYLDIYTFYGTKKQTHKRVMVRTENVKENNVIGTVNFKRPVK